MGIVTQPRREQQHPPAGPLETVNGRRDTAPVLLFDRVSKWYGPVLGVNQVTLELRGGITGLVGANGAGKTTRLRLAPGQAAHRRGAGAGANDGAQRPAHRRLLQGHAPARKDGAAAAPRPAPPDPRRA